MKVTFLYALAASCAVCLLAVAGATEALGAHPFWAVKVALFGVVPGVLLTLVLSLAPRWGVYAAVFDLALAGAVAWYGKMRFVASSGDDVLGGQLWFSGWIAVCACAIAVIALGLRGVRRTARH